MGITMAKLCMAHASTHGARKHAWRTQAAWANIDLVEVENESLLDENQSDRLGVNGDLQEKLIKIEEENEDCSEKERDPDETMSDECNVIDKVNTLSLLKFMRKFRTPTN